MTDESKFQQLARLQYAEIERLRAEVGRKDQELDALVAWIMGDGDSMAGLLAIAADPRTSTANKIKCWGLTLPFERSKPASVVVQVDFKERVRNARLRQYEIDKAQWAAEDAAKMIEHQPTILGGESETDPAA
jgi:hypothetical protein